jgi:hypothetical protein
VIWPQQGSPAKDTPLGEQGECQERHGQQHYGAVVGQAEAKEGDEGKGQRVEAQAPVGRHCREKAPVCGVDSLHYPADGRRQAQPSTLGGQKEAFFWLLFGSRDCC